ncbi:hypothetical protein LSO9J_80013 [Candidatus Liberibacter solanacearum]
MSILALDLGSKMGFAVHLIVYNQIGRMADKVCIAQRSYLRSAP